MLFTTHESYLHMHTLLHKHKHAYMHRSTLSESCELHRSDYSIIATDASATDINDTLDDTIFLLTHGMRWKRVSHSIASLMLKMLKKYSCRIVVLLMCSVKGEFLFKER